MVIFSCSYLDCGVAHWEPMSPVSRKNLPSSNVALSITTDYYIALYAIYADRKDDAENESWVKKYMATLTPYAVGTYPRSWYSDAGDQVLLR